MTFSPAGQINAAQCIVCKDLYTLSHYRGMYINMQYLSEKKHAGCQANFMFPAVVELYGPCLVYICDIMSM